MHRATRLFGEQIAEGMSARLLEGFDADEGDQMAAHALAEKQARPHPATKLQDTNFRALESPRVF